MAVSRTKPLFAAICLALVCLVAATGCNKKQGVDEPAREGLALNVAGIDYNTFITRELNLKIAPDKAFYSGPEAPPNNSLFGIFIQACNHGSKSVTTTAVDNFEVEDNQGNKFQPIPLPADNAFAYQPRMLAKNDCIPEDGSVAQQGPETGSMLLFQFPIQATENRPLELIISAPGGQTRRIDLDL